MFIVIYQFYLKPETEEPFKKTWHLIANYFKTFRGAIGSRLHKTMGDPNNVCWIAYSCWPDKATRDASWPGENAPSSELPDNIKEAVIFMQSCGDPDRKIPELCLEVVDDLLNQWKSAKESPNSSGRYLVKIGLSIEIASFDKASEKWHREKSSNPLPLAINWWMELPP